MRKRIHGRQSIPAMILYSPERAMKFPIPKLALVQSLASISGPPRYPLIPITRVTAAHSTPASPRNKATLFLKNESKERLHLSCKQPIGQAEPTLLSGFKIGRNQTHFVDAGSAHDVDGPGNISKAHRVITFYESDFLGAFFEYVRQARAQRVPRGVFFVDLQFPRIENLNDNRLLHRLGLLLLVWRRRLRNQRIQT